MSLKDKINVKKFNLEKIDKKQFKQRYITSNSAFNIPYEGVQCDWHQIAMLESNEYLIHPDNFIGAEKIFADYGLWNCCDWFASKGIEKNILCATPIRSIIDKLYFEIVVKNRYPKNFDDFNDYMMDEINFNELNKQLTKLYNNINNLQKEYLDKWRNKMNIIKKG